MVYILKSFPSITVPSNFMEWCYFYSHFIGVKNWSLVINKIAQGHLSVIEY